MCSSQLQVNNRGECPKYSKLEITIARKYCLKGTAWKLAFGAGSVGEIVKILACVQPNYTRNTYNIVL